LRPEIEKRITNANTAYEHCPQLKSQSELRAEKTKIYKTIIRPVATYGTVSCMLNEHIAKWLAAFERKVLRRM
jgi:hypothetical protein